MNMLRVGIPYIDTNKPNVFLDFETRDKVATAKVMSIGAAMVGPGLTVDSTFYANVLWQGAQQLGRTESADTVAFWKRQAPVHMELFASPAPIRLDDAYDAFAAWIASMPRAAYIWGRDQDFDCAILWHIQRWLGRGYMRNTHYTKSRAHRMLTCMYPQGELRPPFQGVKHNALDDAVYEAQWFINIVKHIREANENG